MKKVLIAAAVLIMLVPMLGVLAIGLLINPALASCATTAGGVSVGTVPDSLTVTTRDGTTFTLSKTQLQHAATIITVGGGIDGVGRPGVKVALMAALTESSLRQLANPGAYPESMNYPHDGVGSDHDSLGLFQMRPASGWGSVAQLMDPMFQARAFFGGPSGPNFPSPRGCWTFPGGSGWIPGRRPSVSRSVPTRTATRTTSPSPTRSCRRSPAPPVAG